MHLSKKIVVTACAAAFLVSASASAKDKKWSEKSKVDLTSEEAKLGYTFGAQIASNMMSQGIEKRVDVTALVAAIKDITGDIEPRMSPEDMQSAQLRFAQVMQAEQDKVRAEVVAEGEKNKAAGTEFLAKNAKKKGVKVTDSGLQYNAIREGKGKSPTKDDVIKVHYVGKLIDGTEFDSSYDRGQPASFAIAAVIPGFSEGLQLMKEGGKYEFVIPEDLGYGLQAPPSIGPNQSLIFEVELLEVSSQPGQKKEG